MHRIFALLSSHQAKQHRADLGVVGRAELVRLDAASSVRDATQKRSRVNHKAACIYY